MKAFRRRCRAISRASRRPHRPASNTRPACRERTFSATQVGTGSPLIGTSNYPRVGAGYTPSSVGVTVNQTVYNGMQTANRTRQAESNTSIARETLRVTEQTILLNAATVYMDLLRDTALLELQRRNVEVLQEQLRQTRDRFIVGEVTRTDVAQAETEPRGRARAGARRRGEFVAIEGDLPSGRLCRGGHARAGRPGRSPAAAQAAGCDRRSPAPGIPASASPCSASISPRCRSRSTRVRSIRPRPSSAPCSSSGKPTSPGRRCSSSTPSCSASSACRSTRAARSIR